MARHSILFPGSLLLTLAAAPALAGGPSLFGGDAPALRGALSGEPGIGGIYAGDEAALVDMIETGVVVTAPPGEPPPPGGPDPFTPLGVRFGGFTLFPSLDIGAAIIWSNPPPSTGAALPVTPRIRATGAFGALSAELAASATFDLLAAPPDRHLDAADARLDLTFTPGQWIAALGVHASFEPLRADDPELPPGFDELPGALTIGANAAVTVPLGPVAVTGAIAVDRTTYGDVAVGGVPVDQSERNFTTVAGTLRVAGNGGALFTPYAEGTVGRRFYDVPVGTGGFLQDSTFTEVRAGVIYDSAPVLTSDLSVGYRWENPDDPALAALAGVTFRGTSVWSPRETIRVAFDGSVTLQPATPGGGGLAIHQFTLRGEKDVADTVTVALIGDYRADHAAAGVVASGATVGAEIAWQPSRWVIVTAGYAHRWSWNADPLVANTQSDEIRVTATLQR
ncbi:MAG: outer membrane beta-barrel protein [Bauldia sp.]|nr:outer membrane beta-barrel protein [Bauldia sp.]